MWATLTRASPVLTRPMYSSIDFGGSPAGLVRSASRPAMWREGLAGGVTLVGAGTSSGTSAHQHAVDARQPGGDDAPGRPFVGGDEHPPVCGPECCGAGFGDGVQTGAVDVGLEPLRQPGAAA